MKKFILLIITVALFSKLAKAEVSSIDETSVINLEASAAGNVQLSLGEIISQAGANSYAPLSSDYRLGVDYYGGPVALGASLSGESVADEVAANPKRFNLDLNAGFALFNSNGQVVAIVGTAGLRSDTSGKTKGNIFIDGNVNDSQTVQGFKYAGKVQVLITIVKGELSVAFLPYQRHWEIELELETNLTKVLNRFNANFDFADLARLEFIQSVPWDDGKGYNYFQGYVRLSFQKMLIPLSANVGGSGVYLDYGADVSWDTRKKAPGIILFLGARVKL